MPTPDPIALPELPKSLDSVRVIARGVPESARPHGHYYNVEQLRAYGQACYGAALKAHQDELEYHKTDADMLRHQMNELRDWCDTLRSMTNQLPVQDAVPNDDNDISAAIRHHLFVYEVDFGDEGRGRHIRSTDFNKVVADYDTACGPFVQHNSSENFIDIRVPTSAIRNLRAMMATPNFQPKVDGK